MVYQVFIMNFISQIYFELEFFCLELILYRYNDKERIISSGYIPIASKNS